MAKLHLEENTEIGNTGVTLKDLINNYGMMQYVGTTTTGSKWSYVDIISSSVILSDNFKLYNNRTLNVYNAKTISISFRIQFTSDSYSFTNHVKLYVQPTKDGKVVNQKTYEIWNKSDYKEYSLSDLIVNFDGVDYDYIAVTLCKYTDNTNNKIITTDDADNHLTVTILK